MKDSNKEDLRTKRTKKFLVKALLELLEKNSIEEISITDICDRAMVHRTTFYTHFKDKYDLFSYLLKQFSEEIYLRMEIKHQEYPTPKAMYLSLANVVLDIMEENRKQMLAIMKNNSNEMILNIFFENMQSSICNLLEQNEHKNSFQVPLEIMSNFYTGGFISLAIWWLYNPNKYKKEQLLKFCDVLIDEKVCTICTKK